MGYCLQTDLAPRKRTPRVSSAHPKTHTPGPQLQQRGYRYYSPELGRFITADPVHERGGINLFAAFVNNPISLIDGLGTVWTAPQRSRMKPRATITADCGDRIEDLSNYTWMQLELQEYTKWLKDEDGGGVPSLSSAFTMQRVFSIPNTIYVGLGYDTPPVFWWPVMFASWLEAQTHESNGFHVKRIKTYSKSNVESAVKSADIWGFSYWGHGPSLLVSDGTGSYNVYEMQMKVWQDHGLPYLNVRGCATFMQGWEVVATKKGRFVGVTKAPFANAYELITQTGTMAGTYYP